jgi:RND family efflux transporter MFP subunit
MPSPSIRRSMRPLLVIALLAATGLTACGKLPGGKKATDAKAAETAALATIPYSAIANGKVDVEGGIIAVAARRGGIVRDVFVQEGDTVTKGQILARQEDDEPRLAAQRAQAQVLQAKAQIASTEIQLNTAKREQARIQTLVAQKFLSQQAADQADDKVREAAASINSLKAAVAVSEAAAREAAYDLELTVIRAPVDGRIIRRYANPGSGASTLNVSNMFDLEPNVARIVRSEVPEAALGQVTIGQPVEIVSEFDATKTYKGKVLRRAGLFGARKLQSDDPSERADDRVVEVVVSADGAPLLIGQRVLVKFIKPGRG